MRRLLPLLALLSSVACFAPDTVPQPRWFRPELTAVEAGDTTADAPVLRLAPVLSNQHLRERIAWRRADVEYGYYELARWTEAPSEVVTQAVSSALYGSGRVRRSRRGDAPTLHLHVQAFEEVISDDGAHVEVKLLAVLENADGDAFFDEVRSGTLPSDGDPLTIARALGQLTSELTNDLSEAIRKTLVAWGDAQG